MKEQRFKIHQKFLNTKLFALQEKMLRAVEELEQNIYELSSDDNGDRYLFDFDDYSFMKKWKSGEIDTEEALKQLKSMDFEKASKSSLLKNLKAYNESFQTLKHTVDILLEKTIQDVEQNLVPEVVKYLEKTETFLTEVMDVEKDQIKIVHGHMDKSKAEKERFKWEEMTFNQALKFIAANKLQDSDESHVKNKFIVVFNKWFEKTMNVKETHWFMVPPAYRDLFVSTLKIKYSESVSEEHMSFVDAIEVKKNA